MGNNDTRPIIFRQSLADFPCPVALGRKTPYFGLHRYKEGLRFIPPDDDGFVLRGDRRRLLYKGRRQSHQITILGDKAFEYDCILNKEPTTNVITLLIEGAECFDFFRQPDFVKNPFLKGSYAVYKKITLIGEGTGKLCHIHRPLIIDALGRRVWGELAIIGSTLRITIPEQWLAMAKYPVVVDPTVGTSTVGSQYEYFDTDDNSWQPYFFSDAVGTNRYSVPENMAGTVTAYCYFQKYKYRGNSNYYNYNAHVYPIIYSNVNNAPYARLTKNEVEYNHVLSNNETQGWRTSSFTTKQVIQGGSNIWFGVFCGDYHPRFDYFNEKCFVYYHDISEYEEKPDIFPLDWEAIDEDYRSNKIKMSMYFTYNSPQSYSRTLTQGVKLTASPKLAVDYIKNVMQTVDGSALSGGYVTFFRQCIANVTNSAVIDKTVGFVRDMLEEIDVFSVFMNVREIINKIIETVQAGDFVHRAQGLCRELGDTAAVGDTVLYPVLFARSVNDTAMGTDFSRHLGSFVRGLADTADNTAETDHKGEYYRTASDTAQVEGIAIKGLLLFVRIVTQLFIRDYLLRRFLIAREELKLKSCVTRDITLDSRID